MAGGKAEKFIEALRRLEEARDAEALIALHAETCEVGNVISPEKFAGREAAREFWTKYRDTFGEVRSEFRNRVEAGDVVALEWTTAGTSAGGTAITYDGVSLIEFEGELVTRFRAYFNAEDLSRQLTGEGRAAGAS